jgi:uncharacterized protein (TIGR02757 family)
MNKPGLKFTQDILDSVYNSYNGREFVHPDPLEFLYQYKNLKEREIVALIASSLAYGRVAQILKSVSLVLNVIKETGLLPSQFILEKSKPELNKIFKDFKHRFTTGDQLAALLFNCGKTLQKHGSLQKCAASGITKNDTTVIGGLAALADSLTLDGGFTSLVPDPKKGSACKRMNLMFRWMVRKDAVDPGGWNLISPARLIIPLDTHMHQIAKEYNLTSRKNGDMKTALEITAGFKEFSPGDPVKFDFSLTRPGIGGFEKIAALQHN